MYVKCNIYIGFGAASISNFISLSWKFCRLEKKRLLLVSNNKYIITLACVYNVSKTILSLEPNLFWIIYYNIYCIMFLLIFIIKNVYACQIIQWTNFLSRLLKFCVVLFFWNIVYCINTTENKFICV